MITLIFGGGEIDTDFIRGFVDTFDESSLYVIACDKGYEVCEGLGISVDVVIGDFDSADESVLERIKSKDIELIKLNPIKNDTDVEAGLGIAFERTAGDIYIIGGTGGRLDHTMGNVALLGLCSKRERKAYLIDECNRIQMLSKGELLLLTREEQFGRYISVFPYMGVVEGLTMTGFKYPLSDVTLEGFDTLTVSNEIAADVATISLKGGFLIVSESSD